MLRQVFVTNNALSFSTQSFKIIARKYHNEK